MEPNSPNGTATAALLVGLVFLYLLPYGVASVFHKTHPLSVHVLYAIPYGNGDQVVLIGESRGPHSWIRSNLDDQTIHWINRIFFDLPGSVDARWNGRKLSL